MIEIIKHDGAWTVAKAMFEGKNYHIETKHFELPSEFGINNGRISKLFISEGASWNPDKCRCAYDRGWDRRPRTKAAKAIYKEILAMYN